MQLRAAIKLFLLSYRGSKSPETEKWYRRKLADMAGFLGDHMDIGRVTIHDLREWRAGLSGRGYSDHTLHGYVRAARHFFRWLEDEEILDHDPAHRLELPRLPKGGVRGIPHDDLVKILAAASGSPRDLALCWFLYSTGCRVGGLCDLRLGDLCLDAGRAYVREKNKKARTVFLVPQAIEAMRAYLAVRPAKPDDHVFLGLRGPLLTGGVYQVLERLASAAGVEHGWNPHAWRHTRAREFQAELGLGIVSQLMGHASEQITADIYGRLSDDELQRLFSRVTVSPGDS
jgi:site-specific recombinase XerD